MKKNGFTLVELIVALVVLVILSALLFQIFSNTLKGSNKAQILLSIKQNSQLALDIMDKTIRQADKVTCVAHFYNQVDRIQIVTFRNGVYTRFGFYAPIDNPAANGYIYTDNINNCDSDKSASAQILTDTNPTTGISVDARAMGNGFTINSQPGFGDIVRIKFNAGPGMGIASSFINKIDQVNIQTSVTLRGYTEIR